MIEGIYTYVDGLYACLAHDQPYIYECEVI